MNFGIASVAFAGVDLYRELTKISGNNLNGLFSEIMS